MTDDTRPTETDSQQPEQDETQSALNAIEVMIGEPLASDRHNPPDNVDHDPAKAQKDVK